MTSGGDRQLTKIYSPLVLLSCLGNLLKIGGFINEKIYCFISLINDFFIN